MGYYMELFCFKLDFGDKSSKPRAHKMNWVEWIFFSIGVLTTVFALFCITITYLHKSFDDHVDDD